MKKLGCLALCLVLLAGCGAQDDQSRQLNENESQTITIYAMDTVMDLTAYGPNAPKALEAAEAEVGRLNVLLSAQQPTSAIWAINTGAGEPVAVDGEMGALLGRTLEFCRDTDRALDITIYPAVEAWGFPTGEHRVPDEEELAQLREIVNAEAVELSPPESPETVTLAPGMRLDLGAVGKGYAADRIVAIFKDMGVTSALLDLGGNIHCMGTKPDGSDWAIGIRDPEDENSTICAVTGHDIALVTSGAYQRNFTRDGVTYHHILDPKTCAPADSGAASVTIIGPSGFVCDALSTALYVMGPEKAAEYWRQHHDFDMVYYTQEGELFYTSGLEGRLILSGGLEGQMLTWESTGL